MPPFEYGAYRHAFENRRVDRWLAFYSAEAEWRELRDADPPSAPSVMRGREEIGGFLHAVASAPLTIQLSNEVVSDARAGFTVTVTMEDGRRIAENVIVELRNGLIVKQFDVEAWAP